MEYFLVVDGGGSKTKYVLFDETGACINYSIGGKSNHSNFPDGYDGAFREIDSQINKLLESCNIRVSEIKDAILAIAGIDFPSDESYFQDHYTKFGLKHILACNDGYLAVKTTTPSGFGIVYNAGTGTNTVGIDESGKMCKIGGLGNLSGDMGNGYYICTTTFQLIYLDLFVGARKTMLTQLYLSEFSLKDKDEFINTYKYVLFDEYIQEKKQIISIFFRGFNAHDKEAYNLGEKMASRGAEHIIAVMNNLAFKKIIPVTFSGSIHTSADSGEYIDLLKSILVKKCGDVFAFNIARGNPADGAFRWFAERNSL